MSDQIQKSVKTMTYAERTQYYYQQDPIMKKMWEQECKMIRVKDKTKLLSVLNGLTIILWAYLYFTQPVLFSSGLLSMLTTYGIICWADREIKILNIDFKFDQYKYWWVPFIFTIICYLGLMGIQWYYLYHYFRI